MTRHFWGPQTPKFWIMNRLVNPVVRTILCSSVHSLLSGSLLLLKYTGRRSGRRHSLPVMYLERNGELVVFAGQRRDKRWWRNFQPAAPVSVVLRRHSFEGRAEAMLDDDAASGMAWAAYGAKFPRAAAARQGDKPVFVRITLFKEGGPKA
jgi:deazaflavin-dependent oxidoreductase (nitroreductase family)